MQRTILGAMERQRQQQNKQTMQASAALWGLAVKLPKTGRKLGIVTGKGKREGGEEEESPWEKGPISEITQGVYQKNYGSNIEERCRKPIS